MGQLTIQSTACDEGNRVDDTVGYVYKRLPDSVITGIYECNSRCKCKSTCLNRVAQQPLRQKVQIFKTVKRGWGIRTLVDIPQGTFICIYVGKLFNEKEAEQHGMNFGDEYHAELDMIETVEDRKGGYESDVTDIEAEETPRAVDISQVDGAGDED